ncbi:conserved hypothetical protein [Methanothermus fervidus DSM 2088]|uniref:Uncharacterized protein n=1 Tax=Methanothermus fervidus (strain ATCC 43054 / DSM 2088 / JCM 10308 / V24 S) TaxID=523846 RepID=E3GX61_METFV|nr:hypothetical protein [Methanothermus fervidus]ADP78056.1 conserved hypothetical protein [Methanothermus fervidus DSM 2088]
MGNLRYLVILILFIAVIAFICGSVVGIVIGISENFKNYGTMKINQYNITFPFHLTKVMENSFCLEK